MFSRAFWVAALERAVKTAAQSAVLVIGAEQFNAITVDWADVAGFAGGGFALSILTSLASGFVTDTPGPSLANERIRGRHAA